MPEQNEWADSFVWLSGEIAELEARNFVRTSDPRQAASSAVVHEWQPDNDNAGDYRWHPHYATRKAGKAPDYDTRTLADKVEELTAELRALRALVAAQVGEL